MRTWQIALLVGIFCVAAGAAVYYLAEEYEEEVWLGESHQARRNPYLAAQQYLARKGIEIAEENAKLRFDQILTNDTVFLSEVDSILVSDSQIDAAMTWVEGGGTLIVGVGEESKGHDSLLARFDIRAYEDERSLERILLGDDDTADMSPSERMREVNRRARERREKLAKENKSSKRKPVDRGDKNINEFLSDLFDVFRQHEYYRVELGGEVGDIHLAAVDRITLETFGVYDEECYEEDSDCYSEEGYFEKGEASYDDGEASYDNGEASDRQYRGSSSGGGDPLAGISDEHGQRILRVAYGDGTFTAVSSSKLWNNDYVGLADHALFFYYLVPQGSKLHLVYNFDVPSIWQLLKKYFLELILLLFVVLSLWLWRRGLRVEREIIVVEGERRSFAEHLHASARFMTVKRNYKPLVMSLKEDIDAQMRPLYPGFSQLNSASQVTMLVERTELPQNFIESWVGYCNNINSQDELLAALKIGNAIRKKL